MSSREKGPRSNRRPEDVAQYRREAWASRQFMKVVRAYCRECMGGHVHEVAKCTAPECSLFPLRMGGSIREGFDRAADALEAEGYPDLAAKSREKRRAATEAWAERQKDESGEKTE